MELKDVVLSVLSDIQNTEEAQKKQSIEEKQRKKAEPLNIKKQDNNPKTYSSDKTPQPAKNDEEQFLKKLKERILVMFEGFNSPKNKNVEEKLDITINFLEYLLSLTDERLESLNRPKK